MNCSTTYGIAVQSERFGNGWQNVVDNPLNFHSESFIDFKHVLCYWQ